MSEMIGGENMSIFKKLFHLKPKKLSKNLPKRKNAGITIYTSKAKTAMCRRWMR